LSLGFSNSCFIVDIYLSIVIEISFKIMVIKKRPMSKKNKKKQPSASPLFLTCFQTVSAFYTCLN
jgi:hypothetical protein